MQQIEAIAESTNPFPVDFDKAWKWVGYTRKDNAKRVLVNNFKEGLDYQVFLTSEENPIEPISGRPSESIHLTTDCFKKFCMMAGTAVGEAVRNYFIRRNAHIEDTTTGALLLRFQEQITMRGLITIPSKMRKW